MNLNIVLLQFKILNIYLLFGTNGNAFKFQILQHKRSGCRKEPELKTSDLVAVQLKGRNYLNVNLRASEFFVYCNCNNYTVIGH